MAGYGRVLPEDKIPVPHVLKGEQDGDGIIWIPAAQPLQNGRFNLGLPFAEEYLKNNPGVTVGLIPAALGGTPINNLNKGSETYAAAISMAKAAQAEGVIKGVLWHQGESDTTNKTFSESYEAKLHELIGDIRTDLGDPDLPFIAGNLAEFYGTGKAHNNPDRVERIDQVRAALRALPTSMEYTGFVETTGCTSHDTHMVHFDRESFIILGKRYATVYEQTAE